MCNISICCSTDKEALTKYGPYITFVILAIVTGVVCWFMMKTGLGFYDSAIAARVKDCSELLILTIVL